jgi:hypothetical protein
MHAQLQACGALANLAELTVNQDVIANEGAIRPTVTGTTLDT